jgi:formate hydrogenlyase transcriptional activator
LEPIADEIQRLQSCINDLIGVLAIPAAWAGRGSAQIVETLLNALMGMLRLDFAYAWLKDPGGGSPLEVVSFAGSLDLPANPQEMGQLLRGWLGDDSHKWPPRLRKSIGAPAVSIVPIRLGLQDETGIIVVGSRQDDFPGATERLVLNVAANQAVIGLQESWVLSAQKRLAKELDEKVAWQTRELTAANHELKKEITERSRVEENLRRSESFLLEAQRLSHSGSWRHDSSSGTVTVSPEVRRIFGIKPEENSQTTEFFFSRVHPADRPGEERTYARALSAKADFESDYRIVLPDGSIKHVHNTGHPVLNDAGDIVEFVGTVVDVTEQWQARVKLEKALEEIKRLRDRLHDENLALREEITRSSMFEEIVGTSQPLRNVLVQVAKVAPTDSTVLISGETGTGKELIARAIHQRSHRSARAFISVNCGAIPHSLIASELFGHEKGAFTGAMQRRAGRFEAAEGGTLFLDEIAELPMETQTALLRVLQEREFERIGSTEPLKVDVRVVAATNRDLSSSVRNGTFRQDLFYRLNVFPIHLPSLRERADDIPLLVEYLIDRYGKRAGKNFKDIGKHTLELFQAYHWPGNIRELQNVIERAVVLSDSETFLVDESWLKRETTYESSPSASASPAADDPEKALIEAALVKSRGRVSGPSGAAARLGIPRQTLESKILRLGINKHRFKS